MSNYFRYAGETNPRVPASAPLSYRLSEEVYALDGFSEGTNIALLLGGAAILALVLMRRK